MPLSQFYVIALSQYSYKITIDSLKISPKLLQNVIVLVKSVFRTKSLPIAPALCLMLLSSYYAKNYAGIIGSSLGLANKAIIVTRFRLFHNYKL